MIQSRNPRIDVAELERRIADELAREPGVDERLARLASQVHVRTMEAQLTHAEERSVPRATWPEDLKILPFGVSPALKRFALRVLQLAFRDQHEVNAALIRSARESLALVQVLSERLSVLEARLERQRASDRARALELRRRDDEHG
jgi:hypothetical protein